MQSSGGGGGGGGGGSVDPKPKETKDVNDQPLDPDADLDLEFRKTQIYKDLEKKYAANPDAFDRAFYKAFNKWMTSAPQTGPPALKPQFDSDLPAEKKTKYEGMFNKLPERLRVALSEANTRVYVTNRAGDHPDFAETGWDANMVLGDNRTVGDLNFYAPGTNQIFISVSYEDSDGSRNVMVHEAGHALDEHFLKEPEVREWPEDSGNMHDVEIISRDDPEWIEIHENEIKTNPNVDSYYKGGPSGTDDIDGRSETFAEALAAYYEGGVLGVAGIVGSRATAEKLVAIFKLYDLVR